MHFKDAGLPWLFLEAFLLMGAFVTLFNYIGYRLLAEPYHMNQALVGLLSVVYLSGIYSSAQVGALADRLGRRKVFWASIVVMGGGLLMTLTQPLSLIILPLASSCSPCRGWVAWRWASPWSPSASSAATRWPAAGSGAGR